MRDRVARIELQRARSRLPPRRGRQHTGARVRDAEVDVRGRHVRAAASLQQRRDALLVLLLLEERIAVS